MDIKGDYSIRIEMSARKQVEGLLSTTQRLLNHTEIKADVAPDDKEEHIQQIIGYLKENQEIIDDFSMKIGDESVIISSSEGDLVYTIKKMIANNDDGHLRLEMDNDELGPIVWDVCVAGNYFLFDSDDEMAEYVFEKSDP